MKHLARKSFLLGLGAVLLTTPLVLNAQEEAESTRIIL